MSEPENFLSRWSRKKLDAESDTGATAPEAATPADRPGAASADGAPPAFDLASLPSLESIGAGTDIRAFLQAGVPSDISRAALRRAWTSDPAIRDFIGLAENAWDFTAPNGVPGFGPLLAVDDIRRMVAQISGEFDITAEAGTVKPTDPADLSVDAPASDQATGREPEEESEQKPAIAGAVIDPDEMSKVDVAMHHSPAASDYDPTPPRRAHGRALPE